MNKQQLSWFPRWFAYAYLTYMPLHIFLSIWLSTYTGGLSAWKAGKDVVLMLSVPIFLGLAYRRGLFSNRLFRILTVLSGLYVTTHVLLMLLGSQGYSQVALEATAYNTRPLALLLIGIVAGTWLDKEKQRFLIRLVLIVSSVVAVLGVLQYFLPKDVMTHFGYSVARGVKPAFFIDDKPDFPRIMSTLRDPNSLGAYLMIPMTMLVIMVLKAKKRLILLGLLGLQGLALLLTFSRSAWIGAVLSVVLAVVLTYGSVLRALAGRFKYVLIAMVLLFCGVAVMTRDSYVTQNLLLHSDQSTNQADPNELRVSFQRQAIDGIIHEPQGHGPGTAGIVSIRNTNGGQLTENYFLQIGYEVGVVGLLLFLGLLALLIYNLSFRKTLTKNQDMFVLQRALQASFWGYIIVGLLNHVWSNEAVTTQWWLLTGMVLSAQILPRLSPKK